MEDPTIAAMLFPGIFTPWALHSDCIDRSNFLSMSSDEPSVKMLDDQSCLENLPVQRTKAPFVLEESGSYSTIFHFLLFDVTM